MSTDPQSTPKNKRPFLKKGDGIRRFGMLPPPLSARSTSAANTARSPHDEDRRPASTSSLPFGQSHGRPTTATTQDSGIPEDQGRSNESLGQHEPVDEVFEDSSDVMVQSDSGRPLKSNTDVFNPHHSSTPIAQDIDACQERLERCAPNSVRNALQIMEEVQTASSSYTSLNDIAEPPILNRNPPNESDGASNFSNEVHWRHPENNCKDGASITPSRASTPVNVNQDSNATDPSITLPRASDFKLYVPKKGLLRHDSDSMARRTPAHARFRTGSDSVIRGIPFSPISENPDASVSSSQSTDRGCKLAKLARERGIEPGLYPSSVAVPKFVNHKPMPIPTAPHRPDVSLVMTPIFSKKTSNNGGTNELEMMAEQLRYQMMSIDIVKDELAQRYEKRDAIREERFFKLAEKCTALQQKLDDANSAVTQSNDGTKAELRLARDREKAAKKEVADLKKQMENKDREIQDLKKQTVTKASTISSMRLTADKQKQAIAELTTERDTLKDKLARSESLYHKLENDLRYERKLNDLHKKQAAAARVEPPKAAPPVPTYRRPGSLGSDGRIPFRPIVQNHGRLGSNSSTGSSTTNSVPFGTVPRPFQIPDEGQPIRQQPVVVPVQRGGKSVQWSSPVAESIPHDIENGWAPGLLKFLPDDAVLEGETADGPYQKQTYSSSVSQFLWRRRVACGCETLLNALNDYYFYCASGTPCQLIHTAKDGIIEIVVSGIRIRSLPSAELEIHHSENGDKTILKANNQRIEYFYTPESVYPITEVYDGAIGRRQDGEIAGQEEQIDGTGVTAQRDNGSYCNFDNSQISIEHPLFQISRSINPQYAGMFRLVVYEPNSNKKRFLQINVCSKDSVVFIKHVQQVGQSFDKDLCTSHNRCDHLKR